ncbi:MAG: peptide chain release factor 1 [Clostridia bacterium]|nr:peptide chain release factor 1 [Clostridia bacterium]
MLEKLKDIEARCGEIDALLSDPALTRDRVKYAALMREYKRLSPVVAAYRSYRSLFGQLAGAEELERGESDPELRELARAEAALLKEKLEKAETELKLLLLPRDPNDDKNVVIEIRAGAGGEEAALFVAVLYRMYSMYADRAGFSVDLDSANETELGGFREIVFTVSGEGAYSRLKYESGVHRVQRVPETETAGRIHTSTATVAVLPEAEEVEVEIKDADLKIETIKSSGAGGQHINKTESAIRLLHKPSGIVIECQDERSQYKNKEKAMRLLRAKLYDLKEAEQTEKIASERRSQVGTGDRSERIRTYNYPQGRVTDHRIGLTLYSLEEFLDGGIAPMLEALAAEDAAKKLKGSDEI